MNSKALDKVILDFGDQASFALQLLGKICTQTERGACAAEAYTKVCLCSHLSTNMVMDLMFKSLFPTMVFFPPSGVEPKSLFVACLC